MTVSEYLLDHENTQQVYRDQATYQMPVRIVPTQTIHALKVDSTTGIVMQDISTVAHQLEIDDFFLPDLNILPTISKVTNNITVGAEYLNQIYPANGTALKTIGYETKTVKSHIPSVAILLILSVVAIFLINTALIFYCNEKA